MIKIDKQEYDKVIQSLSRVSFNNLFARSVIEKRVSGSIYVNNTKNPETLYIVHPYGMSLLLGDHDIVAFGKVYIVSLADVNEFALAHCVNSLAYAREHIGPAPSADQLKSLRVHIIAQNNRNILSVAVVYSGLVVPYRCFVENVVVNQ